MQLTDAEALEISERTHKACHDGVDVVVKRGDDGSLIIEEQKRGDYAAMLAKKEFIPAIGRFLVPVTPEDVRRQIERNAELSSRARMDSLPDASGGKVQ